MRRAILKELSVEEFANTITHGFGLVLSVAGFGVLLLIAITRGEPLLIIGSAIYGLSLIILYAASTVYHGTTSIELKEKLRLVDHCCIYLLIAGSYTPFGLILLDGTLGQVLLAGIWTFAVAGIAAKLLWHPRFPVVSVASYVVMGWMGIFALGPLLELLGAPAIILALAGGLAYTFGVIFFAWDRLHHNHAIFHLFVLAGSILHYAAVVLYVIPHTTGQ